jgi:hypothetical protein
MGVGDVHNLGEYQVGEQPWLIYGCVPQYGTYHIATFIHDDSRRNGMAKQGWRQSVESVGCGTAGTARVAAAVGTVSQSKGAQGRFPTRIARRTLYHATRARCTRVTAKHSCHE